MADALSRQSVSATSQLCATSSVVVLTWRSTLAAESYNKDAKAAHLISQLSLDANAVPGFQYKQWLLYYKDRHYVRLFVNLQQHLLAMYHNSLEQHLCWPKLHSCFDVCNNVRCNSGTEPLMGQGGHGPPSNF